MRSSDGEVVAMENRAIRITIELPTGTGVEASGATTDEALSLDEYASTAAIDAGPPAPALVAASG